MGQKITRTDFEWTQTDEPHASRRKEMLKKYPQIKTLFGYDPTFKYYIIALVVFQTASLYFIKELSWTMMFIVAYFFGGVINHSLSIAYHEIGHNFAFGHSRPLANKFFGIFCNLPVGFPSFISFWKYHKEHHKYLAVDKYDPDLPTKFEGEFATTPFKKFIQVFMQPFTYTLRPLIFTPVPLVPLEYVNALTQLIYNLIIIYTFGFKAMIYLCTSTIMTMGMHPMSAHLISEHYLFKKGQETYSYYGPFNKLLWNVGYHNEHHDFPAIPGWKLPELKKMAPDYYDNLYCHTSFFNIIYQFITNPAIGTYARIKRELPKINEDN